MEEVRRSDEEPADFRLREDEEDPGRLDRLRKRIDELARGPEGSAAGAGGLSYEKVGELKRASEFNWEDCARILKKAHPNARNKLAEWMDDGSVWDGFVSVVKKNKKARIPRLALARFLDGHWCRDWPELEEYNELPDQAQAAPPDLSITESKTVGERLGINADGNSDEQKVVPERERAVPPSSQEIDDTTIEPKVAAADGESQIPKDSVLQPEQDDPPAIGEVTHARSTIAGLSTVGVDADVHWDPDRRDLHVDRQFWECGPGSYASRIEVKRFLGVTDEEVTEMVEEGWLTELRAGIKWTELIQLAGDRLLVVVWPVYIIETGGWKVASNPPWHQEEEGDYTYDYDSDHMNPVAELHDDGLWLEADGPDKRIHIGYLFEGTPGIFYVDQEAVDKLHDSGIDNIQMAEPQCLLGDHALIVARDEVMQTTKRTTLVRSNAKAVWPFRLNSEELGHPLTRDSNDDSIL